MEKMDVDSPNTDVAGSKGDEVKNSDGVEIKINVKANEKNLKRKRTSVNGLFQNKDKETIIAECNKEIDSLLEYYKELSGKRIIFNDSTYCSNNSLISCLLEESSIAFSKLVDAIYDKMNGKEGVTLAYIASLAIRSGNGLLLKGGKEAMRSNAILHKIITESIPDSVGIQLIGLVMLRDAIPDLLKLDDVIDLVIPRGSNKLVYEIKESTKIPVLGHSDGIFHVYVDKLANMDIAKRVVLDAKIEYPAACNAMETLLVHKDLVETDCFKNIMDQLRAKGVSIYGGPKASTKLDVPLARSLEHEYNSMACAVEIVDDVHAAIDHINDHGSAHTDSIITEDHEVAEVFLNQVDSAAVFHNASTRFLDGARFGLGAEVGISTSRIHAHGPVGVEGLLTTKW